MTIRKPVINEGLCNEKNPVPIHSWGQSFFLDNLVVPSFFQHQSVFVLIAYHKYYHTITIILSSTFVPYYRETLDNVYCRRRYKRCNE